MLIKHLDEIIEGLPKSESIDHKKELIEKGEPFIEKIIDSREIHSDCGVEVATRTYIVYIPSEGTSIEYTGHHYYSLNPKGECRKALTNRLKSIRGIQELIKNCEEFRSDYINWDRKRIMIQKAKAKKIIEKYNIERDIQDKVFNFIFK
ncbi:MAG: hypothetical protein AABX88_01800 [Nanoarchaeota archaeon]